MPGRPAEAGGKVDCGAGAAAGEGLILALSEVIRFIRIFLFVSPNRPVMPEAQRSSGTSSLESAEFRRILGHFATGVAIVTSTGEGRPCGLTLNAVSSVSLDPPLLLVCVERAAQTNRCIRAAGTFGLNILEEGKGETLSRRFAEPLAREKFEGVAYRYGSLGAPVLEQALCWMQCRVTQSHEAGDHTIFVGEVVEADAREGRPLVYYRGGYGRFEP